ncbi:MAG: hypothetical protein HY831_00875 [Candidatus Aenigmarchaeota archaeon]|nr:hypothetical protein [Candidatus Aenigmarchaeota archaeon]
MQSYNEDRKSQDRMAEQIAQGSTTLSQRRSDYLIIEKGVLKEVYDQNGDPVDFTTFMISDSSIPYRRQLADEALRKGEVYEEGNGRGEFKFYVGRVSAVLPRIENPTGMSRPGINNTWLDRQMNENMDIFPTYEDLKKHREDVLYRLAGITKREPEYQEPLRMKDKKKTITHPKDNLQNMETSDIVDYMSRVFPDLWKD